jgi:hypothetical protein
LRKQTQFNRFVAPLVGELSVMFNRDSSRGQDMNPSHELVDRSVMLLRLLLIVGEGD